MGEDGSAGLQQAAPWCVAMISGCSSFRMPRRRLYSPAAPGKPRQSDQRFGAQHTEYSTLLLSYCITHSCPPMTTVQGAVHLSACASGDGRSIAPAGLRWSLSGSLNLASWSSWCRATVCLLVRFFGGMSSSTPPRISAISRPALDEPATLIMPLEDLERAGANLGTEPAKGILLRIPTLLRLSCVCTLTSGPEKGTCKVLGDAGEVLVQEVLQRLGLGGGSQALDELQVHRRWVMLHLLHESAYLC